MSQNVPAQRTRPDMPDYGISEKPQGMMSWDWVDEQMTKARNYWICSVRPDGNPHAAPVWGVWMDGRLYFGSADTSRKARNIAHNPNIVVHLESGDDTVILEGVVERGTDKAVNQRVAALYGPKYDMSIESAAEAGGDYFVFTPKSAFAWLEKDFPNTATRWRFEEGK